MFVRQMHDAAEETGFALAYQALSPAALRSQLRASDAAGQFPDVVEVASVDAPRLVSGGLLREVRNLYERIAGTNGDLFPPLLDLATAGPWADLPTYQKPPVWAIPHVSVGSAWLVRRDLLGNKTIPPPNTFDDFRAAAAKLTDPTASTFGWGAPLPLADVVDDLAQSTLLDFGAGLFESSGMRVAFSPDDVAAALRAFAGLYRSDSGDNYAPTGAVDWSIDDAAAAFANGQVAQSIDHGGMYARIVAATPKLRQQIRALPPPAGPKGRYTASPTTLLAVANRSRWSDLAVDFIERLLSPARYEALIRAGAGSIIPPYAYLTKSPFWDDDPNYPAFAANARGDPARNLGFATPGTPAAMTLPVAEVRAHQILATLLRSVASGRMSAADAAVALGEQSRAVARQGYALQPPATPKPNPEWWRLLTAVQRYVQGTPTPSAGQ